MSAPKGPRPPQIGLVTVCRELHAYRSGSQRPAMNSNAAPASRDANQPGRNQLRVGVDAVHVQTEPRPVDFFSSEMFLLCLANSLGGLGGRAPGRRRGMMNCAHMRLA